MLERALAAEDDRDEALRKVADLERRLRVSLNADPTTATRALSWIGRATEGEELLSEVLLYVRQRSLSATELPPGWVARAEAQIAAVKIMTRDLTPLVERPTDETWTTFWDEKVRGVIRE